MGERLGVSLQAVSKWERGETLPDISLLPDLANVLETTIDNILVGGQRVTDYKRKITTDEVKDAISSLSHIGHIDISDLKRGFSNPHWQETVISYAQEHGIK